MPNSWAGGLRASRAITSAGLKSTSHMKRRGRQIHMQHEAHFHPASGVAATKLTPRRCPS
jgi:hypothetical protein